MRHLLIIIAFITAGIHSLYGQQLVVEGTVRATDIDGGLPVVTVKEKGTSNGTFTDMNGQYRLEVSSVGASLTFSFIGYLEKTVQVPNSGKLDVVLEPDIAGLDEAIVIGYGNEKRSRITGSVGTIDSKEITSMPVLRTEQALQGRAAGVQVTQNSGQPGSTQSIRIRGTGSLNNAEPLFVVDGIPQSGIDYLNPADIESISVLKDAASAAIYGARGGNGVILVTTKKGTAGAPPTISYETYFGIQEPWKYMALLNAEQYGILMNESRVAAGLSPDPLLADPSTLGEGTDWQDEIFERAPIMSHSFSYTQGSDVGSTAITGSYFTQDGIIGGEKGNFERYTFRVNTTQTGGEKFRMGQNVNITHLNRSALAENNEFTTPVVRALNMDPVTPVTRNDGEYSYSMFIDSDIANPANQIATTFDDWTTNRMVASAYAEADLLAGLTYRSTLSIDYSLGSQRIFFPTYDLGIGANDPERPAYEFRPVNSVVRAENQWANWQWEQLLRYDRELENGNQINLIAGYSALKSTYQNVVASRDSLTTNEATQAFLDNSLNAAEQAPRASGGWGESSFLSSFMRGSYAIGDEWNVSATIRRDGSSRFGINNRYGWFPSASLAWNLTEKPWVSEKDWIEFLKIRASWGRNGNADGIGNYDYTSIVINGLNYTFGPDQQQVNGAGPVNTSNPDLKWETVSQSNIGIDADLYDGKFNIVIDAFVKQTNDMLAVVPIPGVVGFNPSPTNIASARNAGVELALGYQHVGKEFSYKVNGNLSVIRNSVTNLGEGGQPISSGSVFGSGDFTALTEIGMPMAYFYGFETAGVFQTQEEADANLAQPDAVAGDLIFVDQDGNGVLDNGDKVMIGNPHPDFTYGLAFEGSRGPFDLNIFIQGSHGNDLYNGIFRYDLNMTNLPISALERWTGEGSTNENPRLSHTDPNRNNRVSDRFIEDGSYLRIKNIQLGYNLPEATLERVGLEACRIYVAGSNVFTFTSYSGLDPEVGTRGTLEIGIDRGFYPSPRMFMVGLNVTF
jgi:TonB-linked SusC/RagA family outer membrane protein